MLGCIAIKLGEVQKGDLDSIKSKSLIASKLAYFLNLLSWECGNGYKGNKPISLAPPSGIKNLSDEEKAVIGDIFRQYGWQSATFLPDGCLRLTP